MSQSQTIRDMYSRLTVFYLDTWEKMGDDFLRMVCNTFVAYDILREVYRQFVEEGQFCKIEDLPTVEKEELFKKFKSLGVDLSKEKTIQVCGIIHTLNFIKQNI